MAEREQYDNNGILYVKYDQALIDKGYTLEYAKQGDVGLDLPVVMDDRLQVKPFRDYYINKENGWFDIPANGIAEVPCGLAVKVPDDAWANIKPRSSTPWKKKLIVFEAVIDSGYTGPLFILVHNPQHGPVRIHEWDRLAQMIIIPKYHVHNVDSFMKSEGINIEDVSELPQTDRADTGFGSSGGITGND